MRASSRPESADVPRSPAFWAGLVLLWSAYAVFSANQSYLFYSLTSPGDTQWGRLFTLSFVYSAAWLAATPGVVVLARRFRVSRTNWWPQVPLHLALAGCTVLAVASATYVLHIWLSPPAPASFLSFVLLQLDVSAFLYFVIVALTHAVDYHGRFRERELRAAQLEQQLANSRLMVLATQLQPHFLFNALNAIAELVHQDPDRADDCIARLGDLLRRSVDTDATQEVPLDRELESLQAYVDIEQLRYRDRLEVAVSVEPGVAHALVPSFLLQPIVENAIRHGTVGSTRPVRITIEARRDGAATVVEVIDDGSGLGERGHQLREGVGLSNTRARLRALYGAAHRLELRDAPAGGTAVTLAVPYRPSHISQPAAPAMIGG